jgi:hypothetical protein
MRPWGERILDRELEANKEVKHLLLYIYACIAAGVHFTIENPKSSLLWHIPEINELITLNICTKYDMDMCAHGLKTPSHIRPVEFFKKPTSILSTFRSLPRLCVRCPGTHLHTSLGRRERFQRKDGTWTSKIEFAGAYTNQFCRKLVNLAWEELGLDASRVEAPQPSRQ